MTEGSRTQLNQMLVDAWGAANVLSVSRAHFYRMLRAGRVPAPVRLGGSVRWRVDELRRWVEAGMPPRSRWAAGFGREGGAR